MSSETPAYPNMASGGRFEALGTLSGENPYAAQGAREARDDRRRENRRDSTGKGRTLARLHRRSGGSRKNGKIGLERNSLGNVYHEVEA